MSDSDVQIAFRGTEEYRANLQKEALQRGMKVTTLLRKAVDAYLDRADKVKEPKPNSSTGVSYPAESAAGGQSARQQLHKWLDVILDSDDSVFRLGITYNLLSWGKNIAERNGEDISELGETPDETFKRLTEEARKTFGYAELPEKDETRGRRRAGGDT